MSYLKNNKMNGNNKNNMDKDVKAKKSIKQLMMEVPQESDPNSLKAQLEATFQVKDKGDQAQADATITGKRKRTTNLKIKDLLAA
ncbi:hypothetical protein ABDZ32_03060 [Aeromonas veronii]|uniref:hypothetical protein n=1 Tax=Aeromonas veronii TaxID=654 RepID=UPI0031FBD2E6